MRFKNRNWMALVVALFTVVSLTPGMSWALSVGGTPIVAIDGDNDSNVTVKVFTLGGTGSYSYGYFLNGGSTFNEFASIWGLSLGLTTFQGGDIIDFALYDGTDYYTLSGDQADSSYSILMNFGNEVTSGSPQQPAGWSDPYYYNANITWYLSDTINTNELAINFNSGNDGVAPLSNGSNSVPEPASLILLGSGLLGIAVLGRKRMARITK